MVVLGVKAKTEFFQGFLRSLGLEEDGPQLRRDLQAPWPSRVIFMASCLGDQKGSSDISDVHFFFGWGGPCRKNGKAVKLFHSAFK